MVSLAMEEYELMKDSKYRVYVSAVDKALKNFEYTSEWADLISALGKLNKVLMNNMKFPVIPRRIKISKRLAQCMHPALPSGVHLKALETYDVIFKCMGTNRLAHELFIYSAGLFPLLGHAAMNVRILLLTVYETHFVPLGERLRPALSGFLSGVLPGLESGSDHYESTNSLLEKVCEGVGASYFYSCLWECLACNGPTRLPAVSFVLGHFNKRLSMAEQPFIMGKDTDVLVIGLCACMRDHSVLVQRSALELLLVGFPLHSSQLQRDVMVKLVVASLTTILRRDMSLNRRLYSWLLGSEVNKSQFDENHPLVKKTQSMVVSGDTSCPYFELYSRKLLIEAIRITLAETAKEDTPDLKPYRLLMSLLDKTEIGPVILDDILYDVIRTLYVTCGERKNNKICEEVLKSANMLFSSLEPYYIWEYLGNCFGNMCRELHTIKSPRLTENITCKSSSTIASDTDYKPPNLLEICTLAEFLLDILPLETYIDTTSEHLPKLFYKITNLLSEYCHVLMVEEIVNSLYLCMKIVSRVQTVVTHSPKTESDNISSRLSVSMLEITKSDTNLKVQKRKDVTGLSIEKSKSDSKLHETTNEILIKDTSKKRSKSLKHKKNKKHRSTESLNSILSMDLEINILQNDMDTDKNTKDNSKYIGVVINETQPDKESDPIKTEKQTLIEKCLRCYELFFVNFISQRLLNLSTSKNNIDDLFNKLLLTDNNYYKTSNDTDNLEKLLNNTLRLSKSEHDELVKPYEISINDHQILTNSLITDRSNCQSLYHAVKLSCRILVELSTFPTYVPQDTSINMVKYHDGMQIPDWLKVLVLCSSFLRNDPDLQLTAISTLLDLVSLLRTQCGSDESDVGVFGVRKSSSSGVTSVVMIPLLRQWHVEYMEKATRIFQILAYSLWEHLGNPMLHNQLLTCASLLHQLHNCLPASCLVEVVLGESMTSEASGRCVESFHRFSTLWHLGRGMEGKACNNAMRTFDKTLLKMLDNLQLPESSPLKLYSASWLIQSLLRGDIHRLLDPVLFILLDPLTARMSVLHVSIHHSSKRLMQRTQSECDSTKKTDSDTSQSSKIYAISSVDGNVIYHVSDSTQSSAAKPSSKIFSRKILNPLKSRKLYSLASNKDKNERSVTGRHYTAKDVIAHAGNLATSPQNISLFVNPFSTTDTSDDSTMDTSTESNQLYPTGRFVKIDSEGGPVHVNYIKGDSGRSDSSSSSLKHSQSIDISNTNPKKSTPNRNSSSGNSTCSNSFGSSNEYYNNNEEPINTSSEYSDQEPFRSGSACDTLISTDCDKTSTSTTPVENQTKLKVVIDLTSKTVEMLEKFENSIHEITDGSFYLPEEAQADEVDNKLNTDEQDEQNHADEEANELELSTAAEDFFSICVGTSSAEDVLNDIIDKVCHMEVEQLAKSVVNESRNKKIYNTDISKGVHPLHTHILLYCEVYDSNRTLYALQTLRNEIATNTRMFICSAATTGIANVPKGTQLLNLLGRHKKSMYGHSFYGDVTNTEYLHSYRSCMYLEVLITICLHFARSYFPNLGNVKLTLEEISGNRKVQLASTEILMLICTELISIVRDSGKGFACYIGDLLSKCKVQKLILQCVMSSVYVMSTAQNKECIKGNLTFTEEIVKFNDPLDNDLSSRKCKFKVSDHTEGFQIQLLRLLLSLIMLDYQVHLHSVDEAPSTPTSVKESPTNTFNLNSLKYNPNLLIPQQPLFLSAILLALQLEHMRHLHQHWTTLLTSALPYMGSNLTHVVISVIHQLCTNIETISKLYHTKSSDSDNCCLPPDYTVTQLEALTVVCHYCLLDSNQQMSHVFNQSYSHGINTGTSNTNPGQIFNNLIHVFMPTPLSQDSCVAKGTQQEAHLQARRVVLSHMPRIVASMAVLWENVTSLKDWEHHSCVLGNPGVVKHQLLEFLSPISLHHGINFLAAIAVAWLERKDNTSRKKILPVANTNQQVLVYLVSEIRVMPMESLVQTVHQVVKSPPPIHGAKPDLSLDVGVLELFYWYMQTASTAQLSDIWPSLLGLLRDGLTLSPSAQFLIIAILNEYVQKCPPFVEKRDQRDLHDITSKLVESISQIAGCCLEQTTWLRRNLAVKEELQSEAETISETNNGNPVVTCGSKLSQLQSVQAQSVLADLLATLLDVAYGSQEKEKVVTILTTLMYNITPYLKNHSQYNVPAFRACSHLLASLSGYPYTRKAWRKDVFDLLLDASLFQMEPKCLVYWRTIIDNLMTHDNTTFRDFMARVSMTQSGSLSIFSSREAEYEQRAQLLRRLAFVIFCSETDQYHKYMPEIQEQLASSLRLLHVVPSVQANVFLCFRVLLLRMSSQHVTSLWPIIISEMVQVFLHIEQELATDTEEFSLHIRLLSALDASWVTNSNNGLHAQGHPHWLQLQLATAKLLDLALVLPAVNLPQFQMYRWAFVSDSEGSGSESYYSSDEDVRLSGHGGVLATAGPLSAVPSGFVPHVTRIARLMDARFDNSQVETIPCKPGELLLTTNRLSSLQELHSFFKTLSMRWHAHRMPDNLGTPTGTGNHSPLALLEAVLENDFLEKLPER